MPKLTEGKTYIFAIIGVVTGLHGAYREVFAIIKKVFYYYEHLEKPINRIYQSLYFSRLMNYTSCVIHEQVLCGK